MPRSVPAVCRQCAGGGLSSALSSYMFVFAPDLHVAPLSEAGGDIKAIWPTYSDLPKWHEGLRFHMHTQYTCIATELTEGFQDTERHTVFIFLASYRKKVHVCFLYSGISVQVSHYIDIQYLKWWS